MAWTQPSVRNVQAWYGHRMWRPVLPARSVRRRVPLWGQRLWRTWIAPSSSRTMTIGRVPISVVMKSPEDGTSLSCPT